MISNASCFENSDEWIHEASCHYDRYSEAETDKNIQGFRDGGYGPMTCKTIQGNGFKGCPSDGCKLRSGEITKAPAGLWTWANKMPVKKEQPTQMASSTAAKPSVIELFLDSAFPYGLFYANESFYAYYAGAWSVQEERAGIRRKIAEYWGASATKKEVENTLSLLKDFQAVDDVDLSQNKHLICLQNGTLDTNTYELIEHSPKHGLMSKTNIEWSPDATCPRWMQFLDEIFAFDIDKAQKIVFVQEWLGYCLVPDTSQHKFVWMVGAGGNGKSVLLSLLTQLVGSSNVSDAHVERLGEKVVRASLAGKLVNISSEMSANATISDGYFKAIVAGDNVEAEGKYKPSCSFKPFVRLIGATNHLPQLLDHSDGFARRAIILTFNRRFSEAEQDHTLEQKLLKELPGILTWAVGGLRQLRERGRFDIPQSSTAALTQYRKESDQVHVFVEECLELVDEGRSAPQEVYLDYQIWCKANGFSPMNKIRFGKRLVEILGDSKRKRSGGKDYWLVTIKPDRGYMGEPVLLAPANEELPTNALLMGGKQYHL